MKKILFIILGFTSTLAFSQNSESKVSGYLSGSISIPGGSQSFKSRSYASIETGICYKNLTAGFVIGRASLEKADFHNMFWEIKASPAIQISPVCFGNVHALYLSILPNERCDKNVLSY